MEIKIGNLCETAGFMGEIILTKNVCSFCNKKDQVVLEIDFCHITDDENNTFENICLDCLNSQAKIL